MIVKCPLCKPHEQDQLHGSQNRVANSTKDPEKARCTVCKILISIPRGKEEKANAKGSKV